MAPAEVPPGELDGGRAMLDDDDVRAELPGDSDFASIPSSSASPANVDEEEADAAAAKGGGGARYNPVSYDDDGDCDYDF